MTARLRKLLSVLGDTFWLLPGAMVVAAILLGVGLVEVDRAGAVPRWLATSPFLYDGGGTGARTLLGAVASSTIGVAGTVFSITIAALSLAAGQMGPRLLRNFTRDRSNQGVLGVFLGTFSYALMVLRSVRTHGEGEFVPHLALSVGIVLAFGSVATLVFFVGHMAGRINVDTVIELVHGDVHDAVRRLSYEAPQPEAPPDAIWRDGVAITDPRDGYLQQLDRGGLADWAAAHGTAIRLLARPGDYVFPGAAIALVDPAVEGAAAAVRAATAVGDERVSADDLEYPIRQLVEIGVRALSPAINDPHTAMSVQDRLGAALCAIATRHLDRGATLRDGRAVLVVPAVDYAGLTDEMFHMIRQNAAGSTAVLAHQLDVLTSVVGRERDPARQAELRRHAALVLGDAERDVTTPDDLEDIRARHRRFERVMRVGAPGLLSVPRTGPSA